MDARTKVLKSAGVLDLRTTSEETLASIRSIRIAGVLITSPETADLVSQIPEANYAGVTIQASVDAQMINGEETISSTSLRELSKPLDLIANGQIIVTAEVTTEDIEKGLGKLWLNGQLLYPEHLAGPIKSRIVVANGQSQPYRDCTKLFIGNLTLDAATLGTLPEGSSVVVTGNVKAFEVLPAEEITRRISMLQVLGKLTTKEEHAEALLGVLDQGLSSTRTERIPAGHDVIEGSVVLSRAKLRSLKHRKIYFRDDVRIEDDVEPGHLLDSLDSVVIRGRLCCPANLEDAITSICDLGAVTAILYSGDLWLEEGDATIAASRFDYLEGKATLVVEGKVALSPDIEPQVLADRLTRVHNFGVIKCTPEQMGAIQARLGTNEGKITNPKPDGESKPDEKDEDKNVINITGVMKL